MATTLEKVTIEKLNPETGATQETLEATSHTTRATTPNENAASATASSKP